MRIGKAAKEYDGPITLNGVGNQKSICDFGIYSIRIPLKDGTEAKMRGVGVDEVTLPFSKYPLKVVEQDIRREVGKSNKSLVSKLPELPRGWGPGRYNDWKALFKILSFRNYKVKIRANFI